MTACLFPEDEEPAQRRPAEAWLWEPPADGSCRGFAFAIPASMEARAAAMLELEGVAAWLEA
ncbi:MAG: hypothetical protein K6E40_12955 [Desulfovibrio sp.]|nr:hypothetical protein [Desulfovibrio sp.]